VRRDVDAVDGQVLTAALRRHIARDGLALGEARMLDRIVRGDLPKEPSNPEMVATGVLLNASLITHGIPAAPGRTAPLVLTDDVRFSLLLDEV
jgi:hypothetical protein